MRTLLIGALAATLVGCSCPQTSQLSMQTFERTSAGQPIEAEPVSLNAKSATSKVRSTSAAKTERPSFAHTGEKSHLALDATKSTEIAAKVEPAPSGQPAETPNLVIATAETEKPSSARAREKKHLAQDTAKSTEIAAKVEPPASGRTAETPDPVIAKAKTTIAAKLEDPTSAEFVDMKRAMRTNTLGQSVDTICGHVKGRKTSGEAIADRPFLYLVKDDEAYVVDGAAGSAAAIAYRNICSQSTIVSG
jgi:hypothetical protein